MAPVSATLGDSHNFGRRVERRKGRIHKPRTLLWEWLLLSRESPLRQHLANASAQAGLGASAFDFLPSLRFFEGKAPHSGQVEAIALEPLGRTSAALRAELVRVVGSSLALWSWLGVADLHWENLALGKDDRGNVVFGPLDIEMILADFALPTETKLLGDADPEYAVECQHAAGLRRVLPYLGKPLEAAQLVALGSAYLTMLDFLGRQSAPIAKLLGALPGFREAPIRVCLRGTAEYVEAEQRELWPPLLAAELEQLARGDVPYFFRLYGKPGIFRFADRELSRVARLPLKGDVPQLEPLLDVRRALGSPRRAKLRREGLLAVLAAFDHPELSGEHAAPGVRVRFGARELMVQLPSAAAGKTAGKAASEVLRSRRGSGELATSMYLPCKCGEVKSVLVPPSTSCQSAKAGV